VAAISLANRLLSFDHVETASRIFSVSDAQNLIDFLHAIIQTDQGRLVQYLSSSLLIDNRCHLGQHNQDLSRHATQLGLEIYPRISLLPRSLFLNRTDIKIDTDDKRKGNYCGVAVKVWRRFGYGISVSNVCFSPYDIGNILKADMPTGNYKRGAFPRQYCSIARHI
jgi:uncharacterized protein with von Willebrand factor type A (vWA) domain